MEKFNQTQGVERQKVFISLIEFERVISISEAVSPESLSFNQIISRNHADKSDLLITIASYIYITCANTWNAVQNITMEQAIETASQILDCQDLTMENIICFIKKCKRGEFGPVYNRIDAGVIMDWFWKYNQERFEAYELARKKERDRDLIPSSRTNNIPGLVNYEKHMAQLKKHK